MVRKGLRLMLEEAGEDIELIGEAADGTAVVALVEQLQPDVVVMDIRMPEMDGIAALKHIRAMWPTIAVLLLTTYDEEELMLQGLQARSMWLYAQRCTLRNAAQRHSRCITRRNADSARNHDPSSLVYKLNIFALISSTL
jgi:DNA-binding NarL/FixJ family response regulator